MNKKVLVCGAGSIGKRHIENLLNLGVNVLVWRTQINLLKNIAKEYNVETYENLDIAIENADAVVVATATDQHIEIALKVLNANKPLFIEKPVSNNWGNIDKLLELSKNKIIEIGCQFRMHPNLIKLNQILQKKETANLLTYRLAMGQRLDAWRKNVDYKKGYSSDEKRGGGALFDLIHQIDIAIWLFGPVLSVNAVLSKRSELLISGDDVTNLLLTHTNGLTGHIQLDMASPVYRCEAEVMTGDSIFKWSFSDSSLYNYTTEKKEIINKLDDEYNRNNMFIDHMKHFLIRIDNNEILPACSLDDGIAALRVALCARESNLTGKKISI
jgi:predicted dehydrogenase